MQGTCNQAVTFGLTWLTAGSRGRGECRLKALSVESKPFRSRYFPPSRRQAKQGKQKRRVDIRLNGGDCCVLTEFVDGWSFDKRSNKAGICQRSTGYRKCPLWHDAAPGATFGTPPHSCVGCLLSMPSSNCSPPVLSPPSPLLTLSDFLTLTHSTYTHSL